MSLNSAQQNSLKEKLDGLKQSIQEELRQHNPESLQIQSGEGDRLTNDALNADEMAQYLHHHAEWQALQRAQARLNENVADICSECGSTIPFARLEAEPTAERCIDCQGKLEANDHRLHLHPHSSM
ncbi:TraR/DksA family transcriptional regulator [Undibacterium aquatile]|jgi:phage/conjugal plasmid C-4 type zinc finger TraR family protein|uniref:TraR/DksA family transcriptional regulator n=1 Tax=Undibacterium aquatile TaxID=1537398 RepID=A0ABR6XFM6_9BURK|nr:TraR/DksA family transcriptional regulator [Undibacterium aquatile]MBC3811719.1 TraR/DksA family transcriptional regulator [Undibacterium aquatile]